MAMLARSILIAAALALSAPVSAQVIFSETFNGVTADPFLNLSGGPGNDSERWADTRYAPDPVDPANRWQFFENTFLARNTLVPGSDQAIQLNEPNGPVDHGVALKVPGIAVDAGSTYVLGFEHWGDNLPGTYTFDVFIDSVLLATITRSFLATGTGTFMTEAFPFIAPDSEIVLEFVDRTTAGFTSGLIDNITVALIPEPGTYALLLAGLGLMGFVATRRRQVRRLAA